MEAELAWLVTHDDTSIDRWIGRGCDVDAAQTVVMVMVEMGVECCLCFTVLEYCCDPLVAHGAHDGVVGSNPPSSVLQHTGSESNGQYSSTTTQNPEPTTKDPP